MWEVPCQTVWNECRIVLKICHSLRTMLKSCWMTNWNQISPNCYAHRPISLHQLLGEVPSFAPVLNQFWRLATSNCKKVYSRGYNLAPLWIYCALYREISLKKTYINTCIHTYIQTNMAWTRFLSVVGLPALRYKAKNNFKRRFNVMRTQ